MFYSCIYFISAVLPGLIKYSDSYFMNCSGSEVEGRRADLAPQQASALMLRRAPLGRRLGLLLIVAGVVVLYDVILPAEQGNNSCQVVREEHTHTHRGEGGY